jgi:hypothetical protein
VQTTSTSYETGGGYDWWPVSYNGSIRYIERISATQFLSDSNPNSGGGSGGSGSGSGSPTAGYISLNSGYVNVRSAPGTGSTAVGQLYNGDTVTFLSNSVGPVNGYYWYQITASSRGYTGYVATDYVVAGSSSGGGGTTPSGTYASNSYLGQYGPEMTANATYIWNYLHNNEGWSKTAVCAILGNMQRESTINPGVWGGLNTNSNVFGLVQWTPATKYTNWAASNGYANNSIEGQLQRIVYESGQGALQWNKDKSTPPKTFQEFLSNPGNLNFATETFCKCYEQAGAVALGERQQHAAYWYNYFN